MFFSSPEEFLAHMQEHAAHNNMARQDYVHKLRDFLLKQSREDLETLDAIVSMSTDAPYAAYVRGQITTIAAVKYNVCPCGTDHDAEASAVFGSSEDSGGVVAPESNSEKSSPKNVDTDTGDGVESTSETLPLNDENWDELANRYGIERVSTYADGEVHPTGLRCKNCLQAYVSLTDRMLREPGMDGCSGCKIKSAQGRPADRQ